MELYDGCQQVSRLKQDMDEVYEAGKQAQYDAFWDAFQNYGNPTNYYYRFCYSGWSDTNYNPKYPITCDTTQTAAGSLFYNNKAITDTKVPIIIRGSVAQYTFLGASSLVTIRNLTLHENVTLPNAFSGCESLCNLTIDGTIGSNIDLRYSPLSKESIMSVIQALSKTKTGGTATFKSNAVIKAFGSTTAGEWVRLIATKPNWTVALA